MGLPFAYVLCSVAHQQSGRAVEQLLGRVLRLPNTRWKKRAELNQAYAFATTTAFQETALALRDGLVQNGFERIEAESLVQAPQQLPGLEEAGQPSSMKSLCPPASTPRSLSKSWNRPCPAV